MSRWFPFLPFGLLVVLAGYFGWQMGKPMTETEIINFYAAEYVRETGGLEIDCAATPSEVEGARMAITCGVVTFVVGPRGGLIDRFERPEA